MKAITIRLPEPLWAQVAETARKRGRTLQEIGVTAYRSFLESFPLDPSVVAALLDRWLALKDGETISLVGLSAHAPGEKRGIVPKTLQWMRSVGLVEFTTSPAGDWYRKLPARGVTN